MGPETGGSEIACQSNKSGVITTGGGFYNFTATPTWQRTTVSDYLNKATPEPGFNPNGRAYPDVALIGVKYQVYVQGKVVPIAGTSASAPVFAAMVSMVNTLYAFGGNTSYFDDVDSGNNKCADLVDGEAYPVVARPDSRPALAGTLSRASGPSRTAIC